MHNLLRCRRGSAAFATVVALVPLIGVVALGAEAGSWYVTKQHAQNAADAAAISGGWRLVCSVMHRRVCPAPIQIQWTIALSNLRHRTGSATRATPPIPAPSVLHPTGTSQSVSVAVGTDASVRATVSQQQPAYLAAVLGLSTVNIRCDSSCPSSNFDETPCILALKGSISFQGSPTVNSPTCGIASNSTAPDAIDFTGNGGLNINAPSFAAGGCSQTGGNQCD